MEFKNIVNVSGKCYDLVTAYSDGVWNVRHGESILQHSLVRFHVQLVLLFFLSSAFHQVLKHLKMSRLTSDLLAGFLVGRTVFERYFPNASDLVFPRVAPEQVMPTLSKLAYIMYTFLAAVKMDPHLVRQTGRKAFIVGLILFVLPYTMMQFSHKTARDVNIVAKGNFQVSFEVYFMAITSGHFVGVSYILTQLKITSSRIGHLALSISLIIELGTFAYTVLIGYWNQFQFASLLISLQGIVFSTAFILFILFGLNNAAHFCIRRLPQGKPMGEMVSTLTIAILLFSACLGDVTGSYYLCGPFIFGLVIPARSPLAEILVEKYEIIASGFLVPIMMMFCAMKVDLWKFYAEYDVTIIYHIAAVGFLIKLIVTFLVVLCCRLGLRDSAALAIILNAKGAIEIGEAISYMSLESGLTEQTSAVFLTFLLSAFQPTLVKLLYNPAKHYIGHQKKCIEYVMDNTDLRIVACAYRQKDAMAAIKILENSNPTKLSPVHVKGLCLEELFCSTTPLLINHRLGQKKSSINQSHSQTTMDIFNYYHAKNQKLTHLNLYTVVSPLKTMHEDICWLSFQESCALIIMPFHKKWKKNGKMSAGSNELREVNINVLERAPCSVGILIDRNTSQGLSSIFVTTATFRVATIFIGGPDDREALAYGMRMATGSTKVHLTVIHLIMAHTENKNESDDWQKVYDEDNIGIVKQKKEVSNNIIYQEEVVSDGSDAAVIVKSIQSSYDLIMVGRRHENRGDFFTGLAEWSELPELGPLGDLLASEDILSGVSVLVMQQQIMKASHSSILN